MANASISQIKVGNTTYDIHDATEYKSPGFVADALLHHTHRSVPELYLSSNLSKSIPNASLTNVWSSSMYDNISGDYDNSADGGGILFVSITFSIPMVNKTDAVVSCCLTTSGSTADVSLDYPTLRQSLYSTRGTTFYGTLSGYFYYDVDDSLFFNMWQNTGSTQTLGYAITGVMFMRNCYEPEADDYNSSDFWPFVYNDTLISQRKQALRALAAEGQY